MDKIIRYNPPQQAIQSLTLILNQGGTNAPTISVLQNTFKGLGVIRGSYQNIGRYLVEWDNPMTADWISQWGYPTQIGQQIVVNFWSATALIIENYDLISFDYQNGLQSVPIVLNAYYGKWANQDNHK